MEEQTSFFRFNRIKFILIPITLFLISSCYTRKSGCLDTLASNFDFTADDPCSDCCTDPFINLTIRHLAGEKLVSAQDTYYNEMGQQYKILNFSYYLSGFMVIREDGKESEVLNKIELSNPDGKFEISDDFGIYRITNTSRNLGTTREFGDYKMFRFVLGLEPEVVNSGVENLPLLHVLNDSLRLRNPQNQLVHQIITIAKGEFFSDTTTYYISGAERGTQYQLDSIFSNSRGTDIRLVLKADYTKWLNNADLSLPAPEIEKSILENSKFIFSVN